MSMRSSSLCWLCLIARARAGDGGSLSRVVDMLSVPIKAMSSSEQKTQATPQPLKVIGAGFGRTGSSSLVVALKQLGFKPYHMKEGVMETHGHLELFSGLAAAERHMRWSAAVDELLEKIANDGFNATTDFPASLLYAEALVRYREARVILGHRASGEEWADSVLASIGRFGRVVAQVPWRWLQMFQQFAVLDAWIWASIGAEIDGATMMPRREDLSAAHDEWVEKVKRHVPADRLLVHQPSEGWEPLCAFLSPFEPGVAARCAEILATGQSYPWVNDTAELQWVILVMQAISTMTPLVPAFAVLFLL